MDKQTLTYLMEKHKSLNDSLSNDMKKEYIALLKEQLKAIDVEISKTHDKIKWITRFFTWLIAITVVSGIITTIAFAILAMVIPAISSAATATTSTPTEMAFYYAVSAPAQSRLDRQSAAKEKILEKLSDQIQSITEVMVDEQKAITSVLTGKNLMDGKQSET